MIMVWAVRQCVLFGDVHAQRNHIQNYQVLVSMLLQILKARLSLWKCQRKLTWDMQEEGRMKVASFWFILGISKVSEESQVNNIGFWVHNFCITIILFMTLDRKKLDLLNQKLHKSMELNLWKKIKINEKLGFLFYIFKIFYNLFK